MIVFKNGQWEKQKHKVIFKEKDKEKVAFTDNVERWKVTTELKKDIEFIRSEEVKLDDEQEKRLRQVNTFNIRETYDYYVNEYVLNNRFPDELKEEERLINHPLKQIQLQEENERQGQELTEKTLNEMLSGQRLSDLELQILLGGN